VATIAKVNMSFGNETAKTELKEDDIVTTARTTVDLEAELSISSFELNAKLEQSAPAKSLICTGRSLLSQLIKFSYLSIIVGNGPESFMEDETTINFQNFVDDKEEVEQRLGKLLGFTQLPERFMNHFLVMFQLEPITAVKKYAFPMKVWKKLVENFLTLLKNDFDQLQDWRFVLVFPL
jgi:hypothetical protein